MDVKQTFALLWALPLLACAAQPDDPISPDRPDFVDSSEVVGKGRFQVETSVAVERNKANGFSDRDYSMPTLLRYGVSDNWELRLQSDGRMREVSDDLVHGQRTRVSGYADLSLSTKWHAADADGALPSIGVIAQWDLDTGSTPFRAPGNSVSLRMGAEWELPDDVGIGVMPGVAWQRNASGERFASGIFGIVLGKTWQERFRAFVGYSAQQIARARDGGSVTTFDIGASYLLTNAVAVDTALSRGLNKNAPDWGWTMGLSAKF